MTVPCDCCATLDTRCRLGQLAPAFAGRLTNVDGNRTPGPGPNAFTWTNWKASGVNVTVQTVGDSLAVQGGAQENGTLAIGVSPPANVIVNVTFSAPVLLRSFGITDLDASTQEAAHTFTPQVAGVYGQKRFVTVASVPCQGALPAANPLGLVRGTVDNDTGGMLFASPSITLLTFTYGRCGTAGLGAFLTELAFDLVAAPLQPVYSCVSDGMLRWFGADGTEIPAAQIVDCPVT